MHLFLGENGSGKTNLLEAISLLSIAKSCRGKEDQDMVEWGASFYRICGQLTNRMGESLRLEVVTELAPRRRKAFFLNDIRTSPSSFVGILPTVTFLPQDLLLFSGPPAERRRFLDQLLCQVSSEYLTALLTYQKLLKQRNALLKRLGAGMESVDSLDPWDHELSLHGATVTLMRLELIGRLQMSIGQEIASLGETWNDITLLYERKTRECEQEALRVEMLQLLRETRPKDILLQSTGIGPHREDWQIATEGRSLPSFASRGQERVAVLALLLLQVSYMELRRGEKPVLLLDDAFSELDDAHQEALLQNIAGHQVLMTALRVPPRAASAALYRVEAGQVMGGVPVPA